MKLESNEVTAEEVKIAVQAANLTFITNHDCSICGVPVGYVVRGDQLFYRSGCGCSWSPDRPIPWQDAADHINIQTRDGGKWGDVRARTAKRFGIDILPVAAPYSQAP